ncbi:MAG: hypothetical protein GY860_01920 [Desulfobacteraceae bacterium]|nr:hypothetical protein [Desulfobacteraceae bacterium]
MYEPIISRGTISENILQECFEMGQTTAAGCDLGIYYKIQDQVLKWYLCFWYPKDFTTGSTGKVHRLFGILFKAIIILIA